MTLGRGTSTAVVAAAARLAAGGDYDTALSLLDLDEATRELPSAIQLRAKILAQQGRFSDAIAAWDEVLEDDGANEEARAGKARAEALARRGSAVVWYRSSLVAGAFTLAAAVLVGLLLFRLAGSGATDPGNEPAREVETAQAAEAAGDAAGSGSVPEAGTEGDLDGLARELSTIAGVATESDGEGVSVFFEGGIFPSLSAEVPASMSEVLVEAASRLSAHPESIGVLAVGTYDDLGLPDGAPYPNNETLALARAHAVARFLQSASGLSPEWFSYQVSAGTFSNATADGRARNRAVVLRLLRAGN